MNQSICSFTGCVNPIHAKGLCNSHRRQQRNGQPLTPIGSKNINKGRICYGPECSRAAVIRGLCDTHASQKRDGRTLKPIESRRKARPGTFCTFEGCGEPRDTWELCSSHYSQLIRGYGLSPVRGTRLYDVETFWSKVDKRDTSDCWPWLGKKSRGGYGFASMNGKHTTAHRVMWELERGPIPDDKVVDHLCSNRSCVNPKHLRVTKQQINAADRAYYPKNNSGYRNVHFDKSRNQWVGVFRHNYKKVWVGRFDTREQAAEAVRIRKIEIYGYEFRDSLDGTK